MKRRNFLKGAAALFALPSLPVKAIASVSSAATAPMASVASTVASRSAVDVAYIWCRQFIESRSDFTPKMLTHSLGFSEKIVEEVIAKMVKNQVVKPTLIKGIYQRIESPIGSSIDFIDHNKLKSILDTKKKYSEFLEAEEMREEELSDVAFIPNVMETTSTHAGICAQPSFA